MLNKSGISHGSRVGDVPWAACDHGRQWIRFHVCVGIAFWILLLEMATIVAADRRTWITDALCTAASSFGGLPTVSGLGR